MLRGQCGGLHRSSQRYSFFFFFVVIVLVVSFFVGQKSRKIIAGGIFINSINSRACLARRAHSSLFLVFTVYKAEGRESAPTKRHKKNKTKTASNDIMLIASPLPYLQCGQAPTPRTAPPPCAARIVLAPVNPVKAIGEPSFCDEKKMKNETKRDKRDFLLTLIRRCSARVTNGSLVVTAVS